MITSLVLLALLVLAAPAAAKPLGVQQQISFTAPLDETGVDSQNSAIAYGGGRSLIVWEQQALEADRGGSDFTVIMGRFVNGAGTPISGAFQVSDADEPECCREAEPDVTYDASRDRFFVVWQSEDFPDQERGGGSDLIRGAIVSSSGDVTPSVVITPDNEALRDPATAYGSASDQFLVAYSDVNGHVWVQKVAAADLALAGDKVNATAGEGDFNDDEALADVAFDAAAGRWMVVWQARWYSISKIPRGDGDHTTEVYGRTYDSALNGSAIQRISHEVGDERDGLARGQEPSVAADEAGGGFMVVYEGWTPVFFDELEFPDFRLKIPFEFKSEIFARRANGDGSLGGGAVQVSDDNPTTVGEDFNLGPVLALARRPDVWHDPNADQFLVTWAQQISPEFLAREDGRIEYEIFGKKIDNAGTGLEGDTQISNHRPDEDESREFDGDLPVVTYDRAVCDYVVSWTGEELQERVTRGGRDEKEEVWDRPYDAPNCPKPEPTSAAAGTVAASRVCTSRRNFPIHLVNRRNRKYEFALVKVNGNPVNVTYGDRVRAQVNLVGLPVGRFAVDIEARLKNGRTLKGVRRYFTCNRKLPPSNGLDRPDAL